MRPASASSPSLKASPAYSVKDHSHAVGKCDRSKTVVEPRLSTQWFIKIQAARGQSHRRGQMKATSALRPINIARPIDEWMRNIHDWCISRQLWWGHRIPAWHCAACEQGDGRARHARRLRALRIRGDHAGNRCTRHVVLLRPAAHVGLRLAATTRPISPPSIRQSLLVTGFDILFFWVARMIMFGCHFMLDVPMPDGSARTLKDAVPFREVYIHALVRDAERQKMSKTKGNVIDPIEIVKRYGTDAVRFTLATMASPGTDIAFSEARTEGYRAFANKIWNAARFLFMQRERLFAGGGVTSYTPIDLATVDRNEAVLLGGDPGNPDTPEQPGPITSRRPLDPLAPLRHGRCRQYRARNLPL